MNADQTILTELIKALQNHIPFDGWSEVSLKMAAEDCGVDETELATLFPAGVIDAIRAYGAHADGDMAAEFLTRHGANLPCMPVHVKIRTMILIRLEQAASHKEVVRRTLAALARPQHAKLAAEMLYDTVDVIWRTAGDTSTDYNFYTKRATLSAVYSATLLAFLSDNSADMAKTEAFLDRRLADIARIPKLTKPAKSMANMAGRMAMRFGSSVMNDRRAPCSMACCPDQP